MELLLVRDHLYKDPDGATISTLSVNGIAECLVCEDMYRGDNMPKDKIPGRTAIPCGRYRVEKTFSPKYQREMYLVKDVPGFQGIRIHAGNDAGDSEGCLLPGRKRDPKNERRVIESVLAVKALEAKMDAIGGGKPGKEPIWITIRLAA